eukprot:4523040-Pleurochrysis_carterae.AAC.2
MHAQTVKPFVKTTYGTMASPTLVCVLCCDQLSPAARPCRRALLRSAAAVRHVVATSSQPRCGVAARTAGGRGGYWC